ncbi:hypothetical protein ACRAJ3_25050 [Rhodococcus pyridinivorans]|uniref:hypothetical protein n=1 Tax=Rhodococcus pyridinivorans TaxID=103816 RepID=UPI003D7FDAB6
MFVGAQVHHPDFEGDGVDPEFIGEFVGVFEVGPHYGFGEVFEWDESLCREDGDGVFFTSCEAGASGEWSAFEVDDLVGEGAAAGYLVEFSVEVDAVVCP